MTAIITGPVMNRWFLKYDAQCCY